MFLTQPYYSYLYEYTESLKELVKNSEIKCNYKCYDKTQNNFIFFNCFDLKSTITSNEFILKEIKYEGNLKFDFNKVTNEVYIRKVPYITINNNIVLPFFTNDIAQIIVDKLNNYIPSEEIKITFSNQLIPLVEDEKTIQIIPNIINTQNHCILTSIIANIQKEKTKILTDTKRYKEHQERINHGKEIALAKKRKILGLDPQDYISPEEFKSALLKKLKTIWINKINNIKRHLEANIQKYKKAMQNGNAEDFRYIMETIISYNRNCEFNEKEIEYYLKTTKNVPSIIKEMIELRNYFKQKEKKLLKNLDSEIIDKATNYILDFDLEFVLPALEETKKDLADIKKQSYEAQAFYNGFAIMCNNFFEYYYKYPNSPAYKKYYEKYQEIWNFEGNIYDIAYEICRNKLLILPLEYIVQIKNLKKQLNLCKKLLFNSKLPTLQFYKNSVLWGSIMQLPYWLRIYGDPIISNETIGHEIFGLFMIKPQINNINFNNIVKFIDGNLFRSQKIENKIVTNEKEMSFYHRLIVTIPKTLSYNNIEKLIDFAHKYSEKINFVCENIDVVITVKKILLKKALNAFYSGKKYFKDWCLINIDSNYYETFLANTPNNKNLWHQYDFSSDYPYRRKEIMSFDKKLELAILYSQNGNNSIDYQLLEALIFGDYTSVNTFIEDINVFNNIIEKHSEKWKKELTISKRK